jgi:hypothetical protein
MSAWAPRVWHTCGEALAVIRAACTLANPGYVYLKGDESCRSWDHPERTRGIRLCTATQQDSP